MAQRGRSISARGRFMVAGLAVGLAVALVVPIQGYLDQRSALRREQVALSREIAQRDALERRLQALQQPEVSEARARQLHLVRPNERLFRIRKLEGDG
jgi:cell division protein FtsB